MWLPCFSMLSTYLFCAVHVTPVHHRAVYWSALRSTCDSRAAVCCLMICSAQYMWLPCITVLSNLFCAVHVTPVHQCAVYWYALRSTYDSRASLCCLICSAQYMWLPCISVLSTDMFSAVHVTPVHQRAVYCYVLRSTCDSCASVCCLLNFSTQYMWLPCLSTLSIELLYAVNVAHVHWSAVSSTRGSYPLFCCMLYTWLMSIDLLYAVHVVHIHCFAVCCTRGSCPLICCMLYTWLITIDLMYAVHVTTVFQYALHRPSVRITGDSTTSVHCFLIYCTQHKWKVYQNVVSW